MGIELDEAARRALAQAQQSLSTYDRLVRWPAAANLHLTLKFLGEVPEADLPGVGEATKRAAARSAPKSSAAAATARRSGWRNGPGSQPG